MMRRGVRNHFSGPHRCDPKYRFYVVQMMPSLFGDWTVMREWGRRGSSGTVRLSSYQWREEAQIPERRTIERRLAHGYSAEVIRSCRSAAFLSCHPPAPKATTVAGTSASGRLRQRPERLL